MFWMTRLISVGALAAAGFAVAGSAHAEKPPKGGCPPHMWVLNDPVEWVEATRAGVAAEGSTMEEQAELFGFETVELFEEWIVANVFDGDIGVDANDDDLVCRATNTPSGYPEFYFQVHDNKHHAKFGA